MSYHLRFQPNEWMTHHVTARCLEGFLFLKPKPEITSLVLGVLGRGMELYKTVIQIHNLVLMSNHYHLLITSKSAEDLSNFMQFFNGNIAREVNRVLNKRRYFWESRYSSHVLLDEKALEDAYKYIFANTFKERLVEHPSDWPGFHGYHLLGEGREIKGIWYDRTSFYNQSRLKKGKGLTLEDFKTVYPITFDRPHIWSSLSDEAFQRKMHGLMDEVLEEWSTEKGESFLGTEVILEQDVYVRRVPKAGKRPICRSGCLQLWKAFQDQYRWFVIEYRNAFFDLRSALKSGVLLDSMCFPHGGIIPRAWVPI